MELVNQLFKVTNNEQTTEKTEIVHHLAKELTLSHHLSRKKIVEDFWARNRGLMVKSKLR